MTPSPALTVTSMRLMGVRADMSYRPVESEHQRREAVGGGALLSPDVLELLLGLPVGVPVPVGRLTARERFGLAEAPPWAAVVDQGQVTRLAVEPVAVDLAQVAARSWRRGLERAGRFTPFCARGIVLDSCPEDDLEMGLEAAYYGVGVTVVRGGDVEVLLRPEPFRRMRHTAAGWRFVERVYQKAMGVPG